MSPEPSKQTALRLSHVGFSYPNGLRAIGDVDFEVKAGEIVSIIGPSGSGKSTLLRLIAGLDRPGSGEITRETTTDRHPCTMVFQEDTLLPWMKVRDNVALHYVFKKGRRADRQEHIDNLLRMVGLEDFADYYPRRLSGGMKRRVAVLAAVAPLPGLLLLDEPFSALDEPTRIGVHRDIYRLIREFQITTVLVTHDLAEAITLSDRILLLSRSPATVVGSYEVPFGQERDLLDLRGEQTFLEMYGEIWSDLETQLRASS